MTYSADRLALSGFAQMMTQLGHDKMPEKGLPPPSKRMPRRHARSDSGPIVGMLFTCASLKESAATGHRMLEETYLIPSHDTRGWPG
jgi:hypothetical protein